MLRFVAILMLLATILGPSVAHAHDVEWEPGPLKQDRIASPALHCTVVGDYQGHRYTWRYRMVGDGDEPDEMAWLRSFCDYAGREDVTRYFRYAEGLDIPASAITVRWRE